MKHFSHQDGASDASEAYPAAKPLETESTTYNGIGAELYAARLRAGLELSDVSQRLRIRLQHLESIERGAFDEIPGRIYAIGFLRTYAEFLGFDGDDIVNRFKAETGGGAAPAKLVFPSPAPESRMPGTAIILVALILAAAAYGAWYYMHDIQRIATELVSDVPERLTTGTDAASDGAMASKSPDETDSAMMSAPAAANADTTAGTAPTDTTAEPATERDAVTVEELQTAEDDTAPAEDTAAEDNLAATAATPSAGQDSLPSQPVAAAQPDTVTEEVVTAATDQPMSEPSTDSTSATERMAALPTPSQPIQAANQSVPSTGQAIATTPGTPVAVEPAPPPPPTAPASQPFNDTDAPQQYGISNTDARVVLRARYDCWVQVRGANDEQFLTKVLRAGDTYHVPNRTDVRLYASDAGALEVLVDGRSIPPIGGPGEIVRDVPLEADTLLNRG